jgi:nicotinamidase-related amidase
MPTKNPDLHGSAPDKSGMALLLIDVINDLEFPEAEQMLDAAMKMARQIARLKKRAHRARVPAIYVNDNFGKWKSDFRATIEHCAEKNVRGREIVKMLKPAEQDYFVLKPKHSGFFSTSLEMLLRYLGSETLILTGIAGNFCVLFTANDAYMRDYKLIVPRDCTVSNTAKENEEALQLMRKFLKAKTPLSKSVRLSTTRTKR